MNTVVVPFPGRDRAAIPVAVRQRKKVVALKAELTARLLELARLAPEDWPEEIGRILGVVMDAIPKPPR